MNQHNPTVSAIRALVIDEINEANSGHPGMALDAASAIYALYRDHLVADPHHPEWRNRDRLIYSSGHATALIYAMLHVAGYGVSMDDLRSFRQLHSHTPGHPEVDATPGVDANAGPLGMGIAQALGFAMAEKAVASSYPEGSRLMDHYTYCLCGDGCLEEGVSQEAIELAAEFQLPKFILICDANGSTLDGPTTDSSHVDVAKRFEAAHWHVIDVPQGESVEDVSAAIGQAKENHDYPTLIVLHTIIGYGAPKMGSNATHGSPLGEVDGAAAKAFFGVDYPKFTCPKAAYEDLASTFAKRGQAAYAAYEKEEKAYASAHPEDYRRFLDAFARNVEPYLPEERTYEDKPEAGRASSGNYLTRLQSKMPFAFGGSADVAGSTKTSVKGLARFTAETPEGRDVHWGIREFAMCAAQNGILLHGGLVSYVSTFFVFSDYAKSALRMASLEKVPAIYLFTHDSLAVGEDGPTHEPVEQLAALRSMPNFDLLRPADAREAEASWKLALLSKSTPTALILSRQNLPLLERSSYEGVKQGGYEVYASAGDPNFAFIATGSEVATCIEAAKLLEAEGLPCIVISMPSYKRFMELPEAKREAILRLPRQRRISVEMGSTYGWGDLAAHHIGVDAFGYSGKDKDVMAEFGFTPSAIANQAKAMIKE